MSSTNATAPIIARNMVAALPPTNRSANVSTRTAPRSLFVSGYAAAKRCAMPFISICASLRELPSRSRPNTISGRRSRRASLGTNGDQSSVLSETSCARA